MSYTDPSKNFKTTMHHRNTSDFQKSDTHIRLDAPGGSEESCACTLCLQYEQHHRARQSQYQDLYPFGLDPPAFEAQTVPITEPVTDSIEMAPASNEEQFKFLISCIRYSNNGKVDFTEVAKECGIVSKGAAAKRYERMMKANGIHQSQSGPTTPSSTRDTPIASSRRKNSPSSAGPSTPAPGSKKRKLDDYAEPTSSMNADDDETPFDVKAESSTAVKSEPLKAEHVDSGKIKAEVVKEEETPQEGAEGSTASAETFVYPPRGGMGFDGADDSTLFDDFLAFGGSIPSISMTPATGNGNGQQGPPESIVIAD